MTSTLCVRSVEFRAVDQPAGDGHTLEGYAVVFNTPTEICSWEGDFLEQVAPGAFRKSLKKKMPVLQYDHGRDARTGSVPIGSIEDVHEDDTGLYVLARLYDNPVIEPIRQAIEGGSISGMSFRFEVIRDEWRDRDGKTIKPDELSALLWEAGDRGPLQRTIREVTLHELGPVVFPAYDSTSVGVRSLLAQLDPDEHKALVHELAAEVRDHVKAIAPPTQMSPARALADAGFESDSIASAMTEQNMSLLKHTGLIPVQLQDTDLTGRPSARSAGGGDSDPEPTGDGSNSTFDDPSTRDAVLRALGAI